MAMVVMATIPILVLYLFFQRYFVEGIAAVASRAEAPPSQRHATGLPSLGAVVRAAVSDYYFNSMRLVPANLVWGCRPCPHRPGW